MASFGEDSNTLRRVFWCCVYLNILLNVPDIGKSNNERKYLVNRLVRFQISMFL